MSIIVLPPSDTIPRRLEKFLRDASDLSVVQGRAALAGGRVWVSSDATRKRTLEVDDLIYPGDRVWLDGCELAVRSEHRYLVLNKPLAVTSTLRDPLGQRDLTQWIEAMPPGVFPVGRLDRETSGLLLFTNDGDLANAVLHPDHHTDKCYWLWLDEHVPDDDPRLRALVEGVLIRGHVARASRVVIQHRTAAYTEVLLTLNEGKNRQIRRMCRALDFYLRALHRLTVGPLGLGGLAVGSFRHLEAKEVEELWAATGGRERAARRKIAALERRAVERRQRGAPDLRLEAWLTAAAPQLARA